MAGPMSLSDRIRTKYRRGGIQSLIASGPSYLVDRVTRPFRSVEKKLVLRAIESGVLTREDILKLSPPEGTTRHFGRSETITISRPRENLSLPPLLENHIGEFQTGRPFICNLNEARLIWESPLALTSEGRIILESIEDSRLLLGDRITGAIRRNGFFRVLADLGRLGGYSSSPSQQYDVAVPLVKHPTTNFYNWIAGHLPKLRVIERYIEKTGSEPSILTSADPPPWVTESLELMGCNLENCVPWDSNRAAVERLLVPFHRLPYPKVGGRPRIPSPDDCQFLRERILGNLSPGGIELPQKVFISRRDAQDRRIANFEDVTETLSSLGFEEYSLERMPFQEQVRLFAGADVIVSPHGAGLTHLIFAQNASVIELFPANDVRHAYFCIASQLGLDYDFLLCEPLGADIHVDIEALETVTEATLSR